MLQPLEEFGAFWSGVIVPSKYEVVVVMELPPQAAVGSDSEKAEIDYQGREVVYIIVVVL